MVRTVGVMLDKHMELEQLAKKTSEKDTITLQEIHQYIQIRRELDRAYQTASPSSRTRRLHKIEEQTDDEFEGENTENDETEQKYTIKQSG